jgi:hypothetical protein
MKYNRHNLGKKSGFGGYTLVGGNRRTTLNRHLDNLKLSNRT